jgi:hypothetical protein
MRVYVVTDINLGWDCVVGTFLVETEEEFQALEKEFGCDNPDEVSDYVIHEQFVKKLVPGEEEEWLK